MERTYEKLKKYFRSDNSVDVLISNSDIFSEIFGINLDDDDWANYYVSLDEPIASMCYIDYFDDVTKETSNLILEYKDNDCKYYFCTIDAEKWTRFKLAVQKEFDYKNWRCEGSNQKTSKSELEKLFSHDIIDVDAHQVLFTQIFGYEPIAPRHRRAFVSQNEPYFYMYGRCGGDNAEEYESEIDKAMNIPGFILAEDDVSDNTYRDFYFNLYPTKWRKFLDHIKTKF